MPCRRFPWGGKSPSLNQSQHNPVPFTHDAATMHPRSVLATGTVFGTLTRCDGFDCSFCPSSFLRQRQRTLRPSLTSDFASSAIKPGRTETASR